MFMQRLLKRAWVRGIIVLVLSVAVVFVVELIFDHKADSVGSTVPFTGSLIWRVAGSHDNEYDVSTPLESTPTLASTPFPASPGPLFTDVHCVCGPAGVSQEELGCVPVVENAVADIHPKVNVTFECFFAPDKDPDAELRRLRSAFESCRARSYFPISQHVFLFAPGPQRPVHEICAELQTSKGVADNTDESGMRHEVSFLIVRWNNWVPFHNLFDHGLFQVWMGWFTVKKYIEERLGKRVLDQPGAHIVDDLSGWFTDPKPAVHTLWLQLLNPAYFLWQRQMRTCSAFHVVGDLRASTSGYMRHGHDFPSPALLGYLREMGAVINRNMISVYGDVHDRDVSSTPILVEDRPVTNSFDAEQRSRGIQPHLRRELLDVLVPAVGPSVVRQFSDRVPMGTQFLHIRSSRVILTSEGSFMAFMMLSRPNTTWICVYNHTRPRGEWMYSNWHAPGAMAFNWMRVIFYVIDHGNREPAQSIVDRFFSPGQPFVPGVFYVGNISAVGKRIEAAA
jgi:hypothetical protein